MPPQYSSPYSMPASPAAAVPMPLYPPKPAPQPYAPGMWHWNRPSTPGSPPVQPSRLPLPLHILAPESRDCNPSLPCGSQCSLLAFSTLAHNAVSQTWPCCRDICGQSLSRHHPGPTLYHSPFTTVQPQPQHGSQCPALPQHPGAHHPTSSCIR